MALTFRAWFLRLALGATSIALPTAAHAAPLNVVATIKPIHSLASAVLEGVSEPTLLLNGASSPHAYALRPSDATALSHADIVLRVSQNLEVFLARPLAALPSRTRVVDLDKSPGLMLLPVRDVALLEASTGEADQAEEEEHHHHHGGPFDVHFWLDPRNAAAMADMMRDVFAGADPEHASIYTANAEKLKTKLASLDTALRAKLSGLHGKPFVVFHDVSQYLEKRYGLQSLGSITLSPERAPGAKRLAQLREKMTNGGAYCVFAEPQFPPKLVQTLIEGTKVRQGTLDEVGANLPSGADQYFALLRTDADNIASCLQG